jgi:hypothetical protein
MGGTYTGIGASKITSPQEAATAVLQTISTGTKNYFNQMKRDAVIAGLIDYGKTERGKSEHGSIDALKQTLDAIPAMALKLNADQKTIEEATKLAYKIRGF